MEHKREDAWVPIEDHLPTEDGEYLCAVQLQPGKPLVVKICVFSVSTSRFDLWPLKVTDWKSRTTPPVKDTK